MSEAPVVSALQTVRHNARRLEGAPGDYDLILERARSARVVLLGEATHGTREFYRARADITRRLVEELGYSAVAVEADWPDAYRVNRYVRGEPQDPDATQALGDFRRFPTWMWRNTEVVQFIDWLRQHNQARAPQDRVGFYGLDLYSLYTSIGAVIDYLDKVDPHQASVARTRYNCLDHVDHEPQEYGIGATRGWRPSCEDEVVEQLQALRQHRAEHLVHNGLLGEDEAFQAERNAAVVRNAEAYYRGMFSRGVNTWNLRDRHMAETLEALLQHRSRAGEPARIVVWEHNSHIGDARATERTDHDELNVGQLARERFGREALLVGFTTQCGSVSAASDWDAPVERKRVRPALPGSYERLFHDAGMTDFLLDLGDEAVREALSEPRLERAIGVIYLPESERYSHYFHARLPQQFDLALHFDETHALEPLERTPGWRAGEADETYPFGV